MRESARVSVIEFVTGSVREREYVRVSEIVSERVIERECE